MVDSYVSTKFGVYSLSGFLRKRVSQTGGQKLISVCYYLWLNNQS